MLDVVVRPTREVAPTSDTPSTVRISRGGAAANLAAALAGFGHDVRYVGAAGDDVSGRTFVEDLTRSGVTCELEFTAASTGVVVAIVAADAERAMLSDRGANRLLTRQHVFEVLGQPVDHLHVSGYTLLDEATRATGVEAIREALGRGISTSVDVCSLAPLLEVTPARFLAASSGSTMIFANEEEAIALSGALDGEGAARMLSGLFSEVVVTLGAKGALARRDAQTFRRTSISDDVLDTTGAGDAATGAYLAARLMDQSIDDALKHAMEAASRVVRVLGSLG